ncbi:unnamed protein product [Vitrella brassicaformis CCMP3155]|uniref:Uncharacterized protein n=1 Tax=Vitrella brassicaformis (strain CCMP3155) TaxID=1169540 RepID=A0A0G4H7Z8_VITBC|nr:unnamed protein product [Vitrella brassicaformis CCMP3155]|eukprot:CEM40051.1 unnamed protein product [Vitrella brassicaformis CCMP3155]
MRAQNCGPHRRASRGCRAFVKAAEARASHHQTMGSASLILALLAASLLLLLPDLPRPCSALSPSRHSSSAPPHGRLSSPPKHAAAGSSFIPPLPRQPSSGVSDENAFPTRQRGDGDEVAVRIESSSVLSAANPKVRDWAAGYTGLADRWQKEIGEGVWWGRPSVFAHDGTYLGKCTARRDVQIGMGDRANVKTLYLVPNRGKLQEFEVLQLMTENIGDDRIYQGKDVYGFGSPFGNICFGHTYNQNWRGNLRFWTQIFPDNVTQTYSNLQFEGPTLKYAITGMYFRADDYYSDTTNKTRDRIEALLEEQEVEGREPFLYDPCEQTWEGEMEIWGSDQTLYGTSKMTLDLRPTTDFYHFMEKVRLEPVEGYPGTMDFLTSGNPRNGLEMENNYHRYLLEHYWHGPHIWGSGQGFGRAMYFEQNVVNEPILITGRNNLALDKYMSIAWEVFVKGVRKYAIIGVLERTTEKLKGVTWKALT